jgi:lincosamide nucleotidyltransferase A/C/D/E
MEGERVLELLQHLAEREIAVWLDGGWGVDALLGGQTRAHDDLDLIARIEAVPVIREVLAALDYTTAHGGPPQSFELVDPEGHQVDVHPVRFTATGEAVYLLDNGDDWVYPVGSLSAMGSIHGREVRCQTPGMQMLAHTTGYALDAAHQADVIALAQRYELVLPRFPMV